MGLVDKLERRGQELLVHGFHAFHVQWPGVLYPAVGRGADHPAGAEALLEGGVDLYELKPDANQERKRGVFWGQSQSGLHGKAFTVDDRYLFVGSFNWDPRSVNINTEMGILIDSPEVTTRASKALKQAVKAETFAVRLEEDDRLTWTENDPDGTRRIYYYEPTGSFWDHFMAGFYGILPIGSQL